MSLIVRLSHLPALRTYLAAAADLPRLNEAFEVARAVFAPAQDAYVAAQRLYKLRYGASAPSEVVIKYYSALSDFERAKRDVHIAQTKLDKANLPEGLLDLPPDVIEQLLSIDPASYGESLYYLMEEDVPNRVLSGMIRGEIPTGCGGCVSGYATVQVTGVTVILDDEVRHPICNEMSEFDASFIDIVIPEIFAGHRLHSLTAFKKKPVSDEVQTGLIANIPSLAGDVKGWIMFGPGGTSKTTYAAAAIIDMLTFRRVENPHAGNLNYWRVKVPTWLREMEAYDSRNYKGPAVAPPDTAPYRLEETTHETGLPPILWIEELDKFRATENRLNMLYSLIDTVYEAGGTIITTTNACPVELEAHLGVPLYRRLTGINDADGNFISVNGWVLPLRKEKK